MWKCRSIRPGMIVRPPRSSARRPRAPACSPAARSPRCGRPEMTMRPDGMGGAPVPSMTCAPSSTSTGSAARPVAGARASMRRGRASRTGSAAMRRIRVELISPPIAQRCQSFSLRRSLRDLMSCAMRRLAAGALVVLLTAHRACPRAGAGAAVRAWEGALALPTTVEGSRRTRTRRSICSPPSASTTPTRFATR